jgi:hypothetical protein
MVGLTLSALLMPVVLTQVSSTRVEVRRVDSLHAAQAGIDVAVAQIRASTNGTDNYSNPKGDTNRLPCNPMTGTMGQGGSSHYRVTINYFSFNPDPHYYVDATTGAINTAWIEANDLACRTTTPSFALIRSQGSDNPETAIIDDSCTSDIRCLRATYTFVTTNANIAGGLVRVFKESGDNFTMCLSAGTATLTEAALAGQALKAAPCDASDPAQLFAYSPDLSLSLAQSRTVDTPDGLCLDSRSVSGTPVQFRRCQAADKATQQWIFVASTAFLATDGSCMRLTSPDTPGTSVVHENVSCNASYNHTSGFSPEPTVGAGAAGAGTGQLVNYRQFGRCIDVPRYNTVFHAPSGDPAENAAHPAVHDGPYLMLWPCKQTTPVEWNQSWNLPVPIPKGEAGVTGLITTTIPPADPPRGSPSGRYCMQSPGSTSAQQYVKIIPCPANQVAPARTSWTVVGDADGDYAKSYVIKDFSGVNCLAPQDATAMLTDPYPFLDGPDISKTVVQPCNGSTLQKWNAPPNVQDSSPLKNIGER